MTMPTLVDFDLEIEREADQYQASVSWKGGQAKRYFTLPFAAPELQEMQAPGRDESEAESRGRQLFELVFAENVRICLESCLAHARTAQVGVRLRLHLGDAPALVPLPWEYLFDPANQSFFALAVESPVVRYVDMLRTHPVLPLKPPLRILVLLSSPQGYVTLDVDREKMLLQDALGTLIERGQVVLDVQEDAQLNALQGRLRRAQEAGEGYHIFHFIGHGGFDQSNGQGYLVLATEDGRSQPVGGRKLGVFLTGHRTLRLALLNACEGARASSAGPFSSVARVLVGRGIPAVVAMRAAIRDKAAVAFTREFYAALAGGWPVDVALTEGRKAIYAFSGVEWATPSLYMGVPDGRVFDLSEAVGAVGGARAVVAPPVAVEQTPLPPAVGDGEPAPSQEGRDPRRAELMQWVVERGDVQSGAFEVMLVRFLRGDSLSEAEKGLLVMTLGMVDQELGARFWTNQSITDGDILDAVERLRQQEQAMSRFSVGGQVANLTGQWQNPVVGGGIVFYQQGTVVTVQEYNAFGQQTGQGQGQVVGNQVAFTLQNNVMGATVSGRLALSADGRTLSGMVSIPGVGASQATFVRVQ